jgi:ribosomal protein S18 acetylase RimI-like enzyme
VPVRGMRLGSDMVVMRVDDAQGNGVRPLDNVAWNALTGPQAGLAERCGQAVRYRPDITPFAALPAEPDERAWADLAALSGAGRTVLLAGSAAVPPADWEPVASIPGLQFDGSGIAVAPDPEAIVLGPADVPEMIDLVKRTQPGPFLQATITMGTYLGLRDASGALVAMAGERMRPPGWTEISAVCTDPAQRGRGLATRLVRAVGAVIRARGEVPFLHTAQSNASAIRVYEQMGFVLRRPTLFAAFRAPATADV